MSNKVFTILHISDLHRNEDGIVPNDTLFSSLVLDSDKYSSGLTENFPKPSVIIVSGDLVFGSDHPEIDISEREIRLQYEEVHAFLNMLVTEFLNGDKSRIIIVPGNHDIQWGVARASMEKVEIHSMDDTIKYKTQLEDSRKSIRWSWSDLSFYRIINEQLYDNRLKLFAEFYTLFYEGKRKYSLKPDEQYEIFDLPKYNLTIVGYNSCFRNDHLNNAGLINPKCLASSFLKVRKYQQIGRLLIATWHHNFSGVPNDNTYLDPRQMKTLIEAGFLLGFHGHQHHSDVVMNHMHFDGSKKIIALSAGTLCSARSHLPTGFKRQYNLVKFDFQLKSCKLFSRESIGNMSDFPIWERGRINESLDSQIKLLIDFPSILLKPGISIDTIDSLIKALKRSEFKYLLEEIAKHSVEDEILRSILVELDSKSDGRFRGAVCDLLVKPANFQETLIFLLYFMETGNKSEANIILNKALEDFGDNPLVVIELNKFKYRINGY